MPVRDDIVLSGISTLSELANKLNVDVKALRLVTLHSSIKCKRECGLPAALNNTNHCILCSQSWYPRLYNKLGEKTTYCRGHGLFGPQFMRQENNTHKSCCCESPLCEKIGYSHQGTFRIPKKEAEQVQFFQAIGIRTAELRQMIQSNPRNYQVAYWHFHPEHRELVEGKWKYKKLAVYKDKENKKFSFPPPNNNLQHFIDHEIPTDNYCRDGYDDTLPTWVTKLARIQKKLITPSETLQSDTPAPSASLASSAPTPLSAAAPTRLFFSPPNPIATNPRPRSKRTALETIAVNNFADRNQYLESGLHKTLQLLRDANATIAAKDKMLRELEQTNSDLRRRIDEIIAENVELKAAMDELASKKSQLPLTFEDLKPGGVLGGKLVDIFTFFPTYEANDAFLDLLNFTEGREPGDGLCENMRRYNLVKMSERKQYNNIGVDGSDSGTVDDESLTLDDDDSQGDDSDTNDDGGYSSNRGRKRKMHWKTEWLVYCFYVHCGMSMERIMPFFGIKSNTTVHNIVYGWANVLYVALREFFPAPTRSQMLRAYPASVFKKFGHAKIYMMLDATEQFANAASNKSVNAILYSVYKHSSTLKFLVGCDPIGTVWAQSISRAFPGAISDPSATRQSQILKHVHYGGAVQLDKGFLIENECAEEGLIAERPQKMMKGQKQQAEVETNRQQKTGKTRIVIEQTNGQAKSSAAYLDRRVRVDQIGLAELIVCSCFLLTNFKLPFIQDRVAPEVSAEGRPCKAEIRWGGSTDEGLVDLRGEVEVWVPPHDMSEPS